MVRIIADSTVHELPTGFAETKHDGRGRLAQIQPVTGRIERLAGRFGQGFQRLEAGHDETGLHLGAHDHDVVKTARKEHPTPLQEGRQAGDAGVGNDNGGIRIAEGIREPPGGTRQRYILCINIFNVSFDRREYERRARAGRVNAGGLDGPLCRLDDDGIEESPPRNGPTPPVHQRSHERLADPEHSLVTLQGRFAPADRREVLRGRRAEGRQDALSNADDLSHSASFSPRVVFNEASAIKSSPTRTTASTREMPKTSSRKRIVVVRVSPTAGNRYTRNFRMAPM